MASTSSIEWTDTTWNPTTGCSRVSAGCDNCYAMRMARRLDGRGVGYDGTTRNKGGVDWTGVVKLHEDRLEQPLRWRKPRRVFVDSMSDLFHPAVPFAFIDKVFAVMALAEEHTFQILTKRPERMAEYLTSHGRYNAIHEAQADLDLPYPDGWTDFEFYPDNGFDNIWLGTSVENQPTADERILHLLRCPAAVRFLSCEPLLGPVDLHQWFYSVEDVSADPYSTSIAEVPYNQGIDWVIVGGESGPGARPMPLKYVRSLIRQCQQAGVPIFVKQLGKYPVADDPEELSACSPGKKGDPNQWPEDLRVRQWPDAVPA